MVAVAEDRVEPGQVRGVAVDDPTAAASPARSATASTAIGAPRSCDWRGGWAMATARASLERVAAGRV